MAFFELTRDTCDSPILVLQTQRTVQDIFLVSLDSASTDPQYDIEVVELLDDL